MSWTKHQASPLLVPPPNSVILENLHQQHLNRYWSNGMCHVLHALHSFPYTQLWRAFSADCQNLVFILQLITEAGMVGCQKNSGCSISLSLKVCRAVKMCYSVQVTSQRPFNELQNQRQTLGNASRLQPVLGSLWAYCKTHNLWWRQMMILISDKILNKSDSERVKSERRLFIAMNVGSCKCFYFFFVNSRRTYNHCNTVVSYSPKYYPYA